jgi:hypothetical protein
MLLRANIGAGNNNSSNTGLCQCIHRTFRYYWQVASGMADPYFVTYDLQTTDPVEGGQTELRTPSKPYTGDGQTDRNSKKL